MMVRPKPEGEKAKPEKEAYEASTEKSWDAILHPGFFAFIVIICNRIKYKNKKE